MASYPWALDRLRAQRTSAQAQAADLAAKLRSLYYPKQAAFGLEGMAYQQWAAACRKMVAAKAAYDAAQLEVRDTLQALANIVAPQEK